MIITRTPFRISFFGGGTDYPAWYREHGGAVLATAIDKYCYISCRHLPPFFDHRFRIVYSAIENVREVSEIAHPAVREVLAWAGVNEGLEIHHDGDLPARSGLGSSSSFTVGLIHALRALEGRYSSKQELAESAIHVEQNVIKEAVGAQDQTTAAFGGFNKIEFHRDDSLTVAPLIAPPERLASLNDHLILFYTGKSRIAADIAKSKIANLKKKQDSLFRMREMVDEAIQILASDSTTIEEFGNLLHDSWLLKRELSDRVSTEDIDTAMEAAHDAGAIGGKILGAGGGGFLLVFAQPQHHAAIKDRLRDFVPVQFRFDNTGSKVVVYQPKGF